MGIRRMSQRGEQLSMPKKKEKEKKKSIISNLWKYVLRTVRVVVLWADQPASQGPAKTRPAEESSGPRLGPSWKEWIDVMAKLSRQLGFWRQILMVQLQWQ